MNAAPTTINEIETTGIELNQAEAISELSKLWLHPTSGFRRLVCASIAEFGLLAGAVKFGNFFNLIS